MVRLKVRHAVVVLRVELMFQFHYGTIKSHVLGYSLSAPASFQFHYGTIKSLSHLEGLEQIELFQFHYGTIKSPSQAYKMLL